MLHLLGDVVDLEHLFMCCVPFQWLRKRIFVSRLHKRFSFAYFNDLFSRFSHYRSQLKIYIDICTFTVALSADSYLWAQAAFSHNSSLIADKKDIWFWLIEINDWIQVHLQHIAIDSWNSKIDFNIFRLAKTFAKRKLWWIVLIPPQRSILCV